MKNRSRLFIFFIIFFFNAAPIYQFSTVQSTDAETDHLTKIQNAECGKILYQNEKKYFDIYESASNIVNRGMLYAEEGSIKSSPKADDKSDDSAKEKNYRSGVLVKVMIISLVVWIGLAFYILLLNRRVAKLEEKLSEL